VVITPEEFLGWREGSLELPPRSVLLTCDDGLANNVSTMLPMLQEAGLRCLFFVTGESLLEMPSLLWYEALYLMMLSGKQMSWQRLGLRTSLESGSRRAAWSTLLTTLSREDRDARLASLQKLRDEFGLSEGWDAEYLAKGPSGERFRLL